MSTIVWFRRDLRIEDNPALSSVDRDAGVLPVFIWCPAEEGQFFPGRVSRWWLKQSLLHLGHSLASLGCPLVLLKADSTISALRQCIAATGAKRLVFNHLYDPVSLLRDSKVKEELARAGVSVHSFNGDLLHEPWEVYDETGHAFTTFDAYWEKSMSLPMQSNLSFPPWKLSPAAGIENLRANSMDELGLENEVEMSSNSLLSRGWSPGWSNADKVLADFVDGGLSEYSKKRMRVDGTSTSLLSPYLHFGELSVRKVYQAVRMKQILWAREGKVEAEESSLLFLRSIGFREYSRYLCFNFPFTHERSLLGNLKHYPWRSDESQFKCWRQGRTGYPLVDAGMRELWATGWMHNRSRVIVSSFFVKFLLLPWTWGMKYFWDTLLDGDLESDILGWQYISGSLPDGHELNRLDSPEDQGRKYDPDGEYVRMWIPELARMPPEWIHHPWDAPHSVLRAAGVELGMNYPKPIVDIDTARERLDDAVSVMWELDTAARIAKLHGLDEVVGENLVGSARTMDIPRVVVRKDVVSCSTTSSSLDQRVPSMHRPRPTPANISSQSKSMSMQMESSRVEGEMSSTAESSSSRKRSLSDSLYAVPSYGGVDADGEFEWQSGTMQESAKQGEEEEEVAGRGMEGWTPAAKRSA